ncbi:MAG TPA: hypothetical protein VEL07_18920 [Planctomycetota bacterium]|nr:hypothetical protein [Planctomycetota bacterium]
MPRVAKLALLIALLSTLADGADIVMQAGSELSRLPSEERLAGARARWETPGTVAWPIGRMTLADAVAALAASGNPTSLADGVDGTTPIELVGGDGDYWRAVLSLCAAADLEPVPGALAGSEPNFRDEPLAGLPVAIACGPLVLGPRDPLRPAPVRGWRGPVLIEAVAVSVNQRLGEDPRRWIDLGLRLRFEPRLESETIGSCQATWRLESGGGEVRVEAAENRPGLSRLVIDDPAEDLARIVLGGALALDLVEPLAVSVPLTPGDGATIATAGGDLVLRLLDEAQAKADGKQMAGVLLEYPAAALAREPQLALSIDGKALASRGGSSHSGGARHERMLYLEDPVDVEHVVRIASALPVAGLSFPLRLAIDLGALPDGERTTAPAYDRASAVAWSAGERSLAEAVAGLAVAGNDVVLDVGVDERRRAHLPAFSGAFWDGAVAVCTAFGLGIVPSAGDEPAAATSPQQQWRFRNGRNFRFNANAVHAAAPIACGPLRLSSDPSPAPQVCGLVLVEPAASTLTVTRGLGGVGRTLTSAVRLRLEPRFARDLVAEASVSWASHGRDQDGRIVALRPAAPPSDGWNPQGADPLAVTVDGLDAASRRVRLDGLLRLELRRPVRHDFALTPGGSRVLQIGDDVLTIELIASDPDDGRAALRISGAPGSLDDLEVSVRDEHGRAKTSTSHSTTSFDAQSEVQTWSYDHLADAPHRIQVGGREALADPCLPFTVAIDVP